MKKDGLLPLKICVFRISYLIVFASACLSAYFFNYGKCFAENISTVEDAKAQKSATDKDDTTTVAGSDKSESNPEESTYAVTLHRPNYFLPVTYNSNPNTETYEQNGRDVPNNYEAKFQLSFKIQLLKGLFRGNGDLYGAYTQLSLWQIYDESSPFRETNYEPELFLKFHTDFNIFGLLNNREFHIGINHQSNGQGGNFSRSWNRIFVQFVATRDNLIIALKPWYRIPESDEDDDNPDIEKYLGYGQLFGAYKWKKNLFSLTFRNNLRSTENKSGLELGWSYEMMNNLRLYLQYFNGYGESLIDYKNYTNRIGCGIMINDWQ